MTQQQSISLVCDWSVMEKKLEICFKNTEEMSDIHSRPVSNLDINVPAVSIEQPDNKL